MSEQERNPIHSFKRLPERGRTFRQEAAEASLSIFDSTPVDKPKHPRRRCSEKLQSDGSMAEVVGAEGPRAPKKSRRKLQGERAESERGAAPGKIAEKAEQKEKHAPRRNSREKASAEQSAELLKRAKLPKTHNTHLDPKAKTKIIPLGSLEQIGMNIMAFECNDTTIAVDRGIILPNKDMLGIDYVISDTSYLKESQSKARGFMITRGHEDHIGALPYILKELNVPVYPIKPIIVLIRRELEGYRLLDSAKLFVVKYNNTVPLDSFNAELTKTNYSISGSSTLAIFGPAGIIFHTSGFKIDRTPVFGEAADLQRMAEPGKRSVLAMLCGSTSVIRPGFTISEKTVGRISNPIFAEHQKNRIIVVTFALDVDRVQQVINSACKYGREVVAKDRSMISIIGIANELSYIKTPEGTLVEVDQLKDYSLEKIVLTTTGSQGESMTALSRIASGMHCKIAINLNDVAIMSSHPILGNEEAADKIISRLLIRGADVIFWDTHAPGHACTEETKLIYSLLCPKFVLPVHGKYHHRRAQVEIAEVAGVPREDTLFMSTGDVVTLTADNCRITDHVQAGGILVGGLGVDDVGNVVLCDRQNLVQNGITIVTIGLRYNSNQLFVGLEIVSWGSVYVKDSGNLIVEARRRVVMVVTDSLGADINNWSRLESAVWDELGDFFWKKMKCTPVTLSITLGVN